MVQLFRKSNLQKINVGSAKGFNYVLNVLRVSSPGLKASDILRIVSDLDIKAADRYFLSVSTPKVSRRVNLYDFNSISTVIVPPFKIIPNDTSDLQIWKQYRIISLLFLPGMSSHYTEICAVTQMSVPEMMDLQLTCSLYPVYSQGNKLHFKTIG